MEEDVSWLHVFGYVLGSILIVLGSGMIGTALGPVRREEDEL